MLADGYEYLIEETSTNNYKVKLIQKKTSKIKEFIVVSQNKKGLISHMESLTDSICNDFMKGIK